MTSIRSTMLRILLSLAALLASLQALPAFAHAGEDHGDAPHPLATVQPLAPRAEAKSDEVELLAVYDNGQLTLYASHFATNAPIADAQIEIESGTHKAVATPIGEGVYLAAAPWLAQPGKHGLIATIESKGVSDLLETSLEIADTQQAAHAAHQRGVGGIAPIALISAIGGLIAIGLAMVVLRRRQ